MVRGILCPKCGKFTPVEHLKKQEWPEWSVRGVAYGYVNPFNGTVLEIKELEYTLVEHECGFEEEQAEPYSYEVELLEDGRIRPVGSYWANLLGVGSFWTAENGQEFRLVKVEKEEYSYFTFVPAGRNEIEENELTGLSFENTNLPYRSARTENGKVLIVEPVGEGR